MPNTLAHFGVQAVGTRSVFPRLDVKWLLLGPVIPDLPWIAQRIHMMAGGFLDPYDVRLYAMIQASLCFSLVLSAAIALVTARPRLVFGILALNCLVHLLLDLVEIKWGNGVHLAAPFSWTLQVGGMVWPENAAILALTGLGLLATLWFCFGSRGEPIGLQVRAKRGILALILAGCYLAGPLLFLGPAERSNSHYIMTLRDSVQRTGQPLQLDRTAVLGGDSGIRIQTFARETIRIANPEGLSPGTWSFQGRFTDPHTLHLDRSHRHEAVLRQAPTYLGLLLLGLAWFLPLMPGRAGYPGMEGRFFR